MTLKPVNKHVLCVPAEEKKGALILREEQFKVIFDVIAVCDKVESIKIGDRIIIEKYNDKPVEIDQDKYHLIPEDRVLAVLE